MKKLLLVIAVLALVASFSVPASASATLYNFTFRDTSGNTYCEGLTVYNYGVPKTLVDGYHWNANCGGGTSYVNGFKAGVSSSYQYAGIGAVLIVSDPYLNPTGVVFLVNTVYKHWTLLESGGGAGETIVNYGTFVNGTMADKKGTKSVAGR
jgi:hypothetical protein